MQIEYKHSYSNFSQILANPGIPKNTFCAIFQEPDFPQTCGFLQKLYLDEYFHYRGKNTHSRTRFSLKSQKPHFWAFLGPFWANLAQNSFFQISENVRFYVHQSYNFMQNFKEIQWRVAEKIQDKRTDGRTDEQASKHKSPSTM